MELRDVLNKLKDMGKISEQDIIDIVGYSQEMKDLATALHTILCFKNHDDDCTFYREDVYSSAWKEPAHVEWFVLAQEFLLRFNLKEVDGLAAVSSAVDVIERCSDATLFIVMKYLISYRVPLSETHEEP